MTLERQTEGIGAGSFSHIEKIHWQPASRESWLVPAIQQGFISGSRGLLMTTCALTVSYAVSLVHVEFWPLAGLSVLSGIAYTLYHFSENVSNLFETFRLQELSRETYTKEAANAAGRIEERIILETHTKHGAATLSDYDYLNCTQDDLIAIARLDALSVRSLQEVGLPFDKAKRLIAELEKQNFIFRVASNQAAVWTEDKGLSLVQKYRNVLEAV